MFSKAIQVTIKSIKRARKDANGGYIYTVETNRGVWNTASGSKAGAFLDANTLRQSSKAATLFLTDRGTIGIINDGWILSR